MSDQLQGLLIPPKEAEPNIVLWFGLTVLLCFFGLMIWRWNRYRKTSVVVAQKKLKYLKRLSCKTVDESQAIALELALLLCQGLGVKRLDQFQASNKPQWMKFHNKLNMACYSSFEKNDIDMKSLLNEAQQWLIQNRS